MFFNKQIIWLLWAPIKTKAQKITIATATATAGKGWEKNIRNKDQATIVAHNKQMQLQVAVAVCSCSFRYIATATDTTHAYTYVERQSYCCCYCILTANANWLDKLLLLLLLLLLFNDRDRKMPPHFEASLGIGCEKQRRRRCNASGLKYLIALYCGWMRRVLKIFTHKPHTHTLPHSVYFPCHTHTHTYIQQLWDSCSSSWSWGVWVFAFFTPFSLFLCPLLLSLQSKPSDQRISMRYICSIYMQPATFRIVKTITIALFKEFSIFDLFAFELHNVVCSILMFILLEIYSSYLFIYSLAHLIKRNIVFPLHYMFIIIITIMFVAVQTARHVAHYF